MPVVLLVCKILGDSKLTKHLLTTAVSATAFLLGACSTFAASVPAPVPSIADGFVSIAVGGKNMADSFDSDTVSGVSLEGAASGEYNFSANLGFQGDLVLKSQGFSDSDFSEDRNVETAIQIQTEFAKSAYESFVAEATKIGDLYAKLAKEAFKPLETAYATVSAK